MILDQQGKVAGIIGMGSAILWAIAASIEFQFGLQPPGNGTLLYYVDQLIFLVALVSELVLLLGMWRGKATGWSVFGKISLGIFIFGMTSLVVGQIILLITNNPHIILLPIGGLAQLLGVILTGIAVIIAKRWSGWRRFTLLFQSLVFLIILIIPALVSNQQTTLPGELLYQVAWFFTSLALFIETRKSIQIKPVGEAAI